MSEGLAWSVLYTVDVVLREMGTSLHAPIEELSVCSHYDLEYIRRFTLSVAQAEERCIHDLILDQCRATPNAIAIMSSWENQNMTYAELNQTSSQLAYRLTELGVSSEVFVLCCFEKSVWAIVARLAVLRAGGAYVMIDARNPPAYLHSIIRRAKIQIMLTAPEFSNQSKFQELVPTIVEVSQRSLQALPSQPIPSTVHVNPQNACLILFTSGSTGSPKGIIQTHRSYATAIRDYSKILKMGPKTRLLQFDDYAFDIANNDYMAPLMTGGCCCVPRGFSPENPPTISKLVHEINALQANATFLTPTVAVQINPEDVKSLNLVCIGGEAMPQDLLTKWAGKAKLVNQYGMGEVATFCAYNDHPTVEKPATIGRPGCNTIWLVSLSSPERLTPVGAVGEVLIEGVNIARGYLDTQTRPTGARFLVNTPSWMADIHPGRAIMPMYLSGDLAKYNHDGTLEYVGRKDLLLKLDGCRVDAIEVEHCARKSLHPSDAIIIDLLGSISNTVTPVLTAYLYLHDHPLAKVGTNHGTLFWSSSSCVQASRKVAEIQSVLRELLPYYMVPTNFLIVNQIPKTKSKKTDRKKLRSDAEQYWKQASVQRRHLCLIENTDAASDLLIRKLALGTQSALLSYNGDDFFLPATRIEHKLGLKEKKLQDWNEDERSQMHQVYQSCFEKLEKHVVDGESEGRIVFVVQQAQSLSEPVSRFQLISGQIIKEAPWTVQVPNTFVMDPARSIFNKTLLPDTFLETWLPTFIIQHPALAFPAQLRASSGNSGTNGINGSGSCYPISQTLYWTRTLYDFYSEYLSQGKTAGKDSNNIWVRNLIFQSNFVCYRRSNFT
jgi:amino acid adenylation domain-containing protein